MRFLRLGIAVVGLGLVTAAGAQSHRWESLQELKPNATLIVGTSSRYGGIAFDCCRMVSTDAASLTCMEPGRQGARLVFPKEQVEVVSKVTKRFPAAAILAVVCGGILLGGIVSGSSSVIVVSFIFGAIAGGALAEQQGLDAILGRPPARPENIHPVYRRVQVPPSINALPPVGILDPMRAPPEGP